MTRTRGIAREVCALVLAILGGLAMIALAGLLASRLDWLALGLLVGGTLALGLGIALGRYDPDVPARPRRGERRLARPDEIVMVPRVRGDGKPPSP